MTHDHNKKSNSIVFHTPHFGIEMIIKDIFLLKTTTNKFTLKF